MVKIEVDCWEVDKLDKTEVDEFSVVKDDNCEVWVVTKPVTLSALVELESTGVEKNDWEDVIGREELSKEKLVVSVDDWEENWFELVAVLWEETLLFVELELEVVVVFANVGRDFLVVGAVIGYSVDDVVNIDL